MRVREDAPEIYFFGCNHDDSVCKVIFVDRDDAVITQPKNGSFPIPLKYLAKVEDEAKEAKFKVGDFACWNLVKVKIAEIRDNGDVIAHTYDGYQIVGRECDFEPYTEPTEQTEVEKEPNVGSIKIPVEVDLTDSFWDAYTADRAKDIAVKVANKFNDPEQAAEYAVSVAKAVVEGLKRKRVCR